MLVKMDAPLLDGASCGRGRCYDLVSLPALVGGCPQDLNRNTLPNHQGEKRPLFVVWSLVQMYVHALELLGRVLLE